MASHTFSMEFEKDPRRFQTLPTPQNQPPPYPRSFAHATQSELFTDSPPPYSNSQYIQPSPANYSDPPLAPPPAHRLQPPSPHAFSRSRSDPRAVASSSAILSRPVKGPDGIPIVIPQITTTWKGAFASPFMRCYPPCLAAQSIDPATFLTFIDGFNEAWLGSPVFNALSLVGGALPMGGLLSLQIAGVALQAAAGLGSAATSYMRARAYVKSINEQLFHPAGLQAQVLTTGKLVSKVGYSGDRLRLDQPGSGQCATDPYTTENLSTSGSSSSAAHITASVRGQEGVVRRQLEALSGLVQPLTFDVPAPVASDNVLKRMGEWQAKRLAASQDKKVRKREEKALEKLGKAEKKAQKMEEKMEKKPEKYAKYERKLAEKEEKAERKHGRISDGELELAGKRHAKEENTANKVRWIVISEWTPGASMPEVEDENSDGSEKPHGR